MEHIQTVPVHKVLKFNNYNKGENMGSLDDVSREIERKCEKQNYIEKKKQRELDGWDKMSAAEKTEFLYDHMLDIAIIIRRMQS